MSHPPSSVPGNRWLSGISPHRSFRKTQRFAAVNCRKIQTINASDCRARSDWTRRGWKEAVWEWTQKEEQPEIDFVLPAMSGAICFGKARLCGLPRRFSKNVSALDVGGFLDFYPLPVETCPARKGKPRLCEGRACMQNRLLVESGLISRA